MKKIILILVVACIVFFIDAQLRIRQQNPTWKAHELTCCVDERNAIVPYGVASAEDAVNALREEIINKYDAGIYQADWAKDRNKLLEIISSLGFTPETRKSSLSRYEDDVISDSSD